jgi:hypothetical protein
MPLVGPAEQECARAARLERGLELPRQALRLHGIFVAAAVEADLGHQERPLAAQVVQSQEIVGEALPRLEVDVEADEIEERELEELR